MCSFELPPIPYLHTRFTLEAQRAAHLPPHKGSLLRGAFGHALRRNVCMQAPDTLCGGCAFRQNCAYARLYEFLPSDDRCGFVGGQPAAPRPYVFEALDERRDFSAGDRFDFDLLLFGEAVNWQAYAWLAIESMASRGLGSQRHPFRLVASQVRDANGDWRLFDDPRSPLSSLAPPVVVTPAARFAERALLRFLTPTRVVHGGRLQQEFSFRTLVEKALRRVLELAHFYTPRQAHDWNLEPWLNLADRIATVSRNTRWLDIPRYSNRQRRRMKLGGVVGEWALEGPLTVLTPVLQLAEIVHIGKATTFGLGKVEMVW